MAKISARGDSTMIQLRKPNGGLVVVTRRGRLLEQRIKGSGYTLIDPHWVRAGVTSDCRSSVTDYLLKHRYPNSEVVR